MAKAIIRIDNCAFTHNPALLKSAKYVVKTTSGDTTTTTETAIENANIVAIGGLITGEREVHEVVAPVKGSTYFGIVCTPEIEYDEKGYHGLDTYTNEAGQVIRVGIVQKGDIFSATADAFDTTPVKDNLIELQAATKMKTVATATAGSTQVGKVIAVETSGRFTFYVVEVQ